VPTVKLNQSGEGTAMKHQYIVLLRGITNVSMQPFRQAMEELGFTDIESYGASGNLLFNAAGSDPSTYEWQIGERLGTPAFVRTRADLSRIVAQDPFRGRPGASVLFLARAVAAARRRAFDSLEFEADRPLLRGRTVYLIHTARLRGKRTSLDLERYLGLRGTIRSSRTVEKLHARMSSGDR
jgi:uncharacterized protein (DUF1697 family)